MRRSPVDSRSARYVARQSVSDWGMHKDAPLKNNTESAKVLTFQKPTGRIIYSAAPSRESDHG